MFTKDPRVIEIEKILLDYSAARGEWASKAMEDEDFAIGNQWTASDTEELEEKHHAAVVINVLYPAIDQAVAMLTTNKPRFSSTGREDSDIQTGRIFSEIMSYIWDKSSGNAELKTTIYDAYVKGLGYLMAYYDPNLDFGKGEVVIKFVNPFDVFVDPNTTDKYFRDAGNIIISQLITKDEAQRCYPNVDLSEAQTSDTSRRPTTGRVGDYNISNPQILNNTHEIIEIIDCYSKIKQGEYHIYLPEANYENVFTEDEFQEFVQGMAVIQSQGGQYKLIIRPEEVQEAMSMHEQTGGQFYYIQDPNTGQQQMMTGEPTPETEQFMVPNSFTELRPMQIMQLIENQTIPIESVFMTRIKRTLSAGGVLIFDEIIEKITEYPIVPLSFSHQRTPFPRSEVSRVKGPQQTINKTRSLILAHAASTASSRVLVQRGSVDKKTFEADWNKAGSSILEVDMELGQPIVTAPPPLPNELYKTEADMRHDIQEILGIYPMMQGDAGSAPPTYKGTVALDEYGQRRIKSKKDDVEGMLNQLAKVIVQFIQAFYTEPKVMRLLKPNNVDAEIKLNFPIFDDVTKDVIGKLNDVTVGEYDVIVVSGSMLPSNRWAQLEYYMELYKNGIIDQVEVLKKTEVADTTGVLERHSMITQLQQQVQSMQEEIKKLQGDLQTADRETIAARKRAEIAKFQTDLNTMKSTGEATLHVFKNRMNDELKIERLKNESQRQSNKSKK